MGKYGKNIEKYGEIGEILNLGIILMGKWLI